MFTENELDEIEARNFGIRVNPIGRPSNNPLQRSAKVNLNTKLIH